MFPVARPDGPPQATAELVRRGRVLDEPSVIHLTRGAVAPDRSRAATEDVAVLLIGPQGGSTWPTRVR